MGPMPKNANIPREPECAERGSQLLQGAHQVTLPAAANEEIAEAALQHIHGDETREELQAYSRRLVNRIEEERRSLARELHDESGQALTGLLLGLGVLQRRADCSDEMRERLGELKRQTEAIMEGLHRLSRNLRPASLDRLGLAPAVRQHLEDFEKQYGLPFEFEAAGLFEDGHLPTEAKVTVYRIVQEALTNVARHANATSAKVLLQETDDRILAFIEDDGCGFDVAEAADRGRLGLLGMRERAEMLGGSLEIESSPGSGTTVILSVPIDSVVAERPAALAPCAAITEHGEVQGG